MIFFLIWKWHENVWYDFRCDDNAVSICKFDCDALVSVLYHALCPPSPCFLLYLTMSECFSWCGVFLCGRSVFITFRMWSSVSRCRWHVAGLGLIGKMRCIPSMLFDCRPGLQRHAPHVLGVRFTHYSHWHSTLPPSPPSTANPLSVFGRSCLVCLHRFEIWHFFPLFFCVWWLHFVKAGFGEFVGVFFLARSNYLVDPPMVGLRGTL